LTEVVMPRLDPGMQSGKIVEWLKKEGDTVGKGEPVLVVEGEKTTFEVEAPDSGVLSKILAPVGTDVQVAQPVALIGELGQFPAKTPEDIPTTKPEPTTSQSAQRPTAPTAERVIASPAARRLAQEYGIDISKIAGTGPGGRISRGDILATVQEVSPESKTSSKVRHPAESHKIKLEGVRKAVAERLGFSARTVVPVTLTMEADATKLVALKNKEDHISFTAYVVKAVAKALEKNPSLNSSIEENEITIYSDINVAVAINTDQGLVAPLIEHANKKSVKEINGEIEQLSQKARENRLSVEDLTGGTFTISNLGAYDIETFVPVINPPQCAILGLGRIAYKPFALGGRVSARPSTTLALVFDHRIVDGVPAAKFLREVKVNLEDPEGLLSG
jgi:pyruvate dehydrogenase E2 component (dihydrolipoamide acetyltransferase)